MPAADGDHRLLVAFLHKPQETRPNGATAFTKQLIYFLHGKQAIFWNEFISHFARSSIVRLLTKREMPSE